VHFHSYIKGRFSILFLFGADSPIFYPFPCSFLLSLNDFFFFNLI